MKRCFLLCVFLTLLACDEDATGVDGGPCTNECEGLAMRIDSVRIILPPGQTTVFSGDSVTANVFLTNVGSVTPDTLTRVMLQDFGNAFGSLPVGGLAPGASKRLPVNVSLRNAAASAVPSAPAPGDAHRITATVSERIYVIVNINSPVDYSLRVSEVL